MAKATPTSQLLSSRSESSWLVRPLAEEFSGSTGGAGWFFSFGWLKCNEVSSASMHLPGALLLVLILLLVLYATLNTSGLLLGYPCLHSDFSRMGPTSSAWKGTVCWAPKFTRMARRACCLLGGSEAQGQDFHLPVPNTHVLSPRRAHGEPTTL